MSLRNGHCERDCDHSHINGGARLLVVCRTIERTGIYPVLSAVSVCAHAAIAACDAAEFREMDAYTVGRITESVEAGYPPAKRLDVIDDTRVLIAVGLVLVISAVIRG